MGCGRLRGKFLEEENIRVGFFERDRPGTRREGLPAAAVRHHHTFQETAGRNGLEARALHRPV